MEELWICAVLVSVGCSMALQAAAVLAIWRLSRPQEPVRSRPETEEEQEARRTAAEAQRLYEQGFVNLMRYDGSPAGREREPW